MIVSSVASEQHKLFLKNECNNIEKKLILSFRTFLTLLQKL